MEFQVLGAFTVLDDTEPRVITRRKCQALLALLVSRYPHAMSTDAIAEALWPDTDPRKALNSVRVHATYLRQALRSPTELLPRTPGGYRIAVTRDQIDATRFEDRLTEARSAAAAGDATGAARLFAAALAGWGGDAYDEFPDIDALRDERARLQGMWLDALEEYATVLLDDDRADETCRLLLPVVEIHLHHETLVARLMLGLHRTGRQQDALAIFAKVKDALDDRGMVPTPQLQELANAILLHDATLDAARAAPRRSRRVVPPRRRAEFIGRSPELRALTRCWEAATRGNPQLVHLCGDAGLGKTTLARQFTEHARADGAIAIAGGCDPDPAENYEPFPTLVRRVLQDDPPADSMPSMLGELARLAPDLRGQLPDTREPAEPGAGRQRLFSAVAELLAAPTRPRLLVIEDLHWARPDAVMLLRHVVRHARGQVMVLATYRHTEFSSEAFPGLRATTGRLTKPDLRLDLEPMNHHEVRALIDALAPNDRREEWISQLHELVNVTAGNPLRVREVLRQLELEPEVAIAEIVPEDVRGLVARRLQSLEPEARIVVQTASVLGRKFSLGEVATASGLAEEAVLDALEESMAQGLVVESDRIDDFMFTHPLFRNALYYSLSQSRRARLHVRCGEAIAAEYPGLTEATRSTEAARHYLAARPVSDPGRTATFARIAGDDAASRYAHEEAAGWYHHAVGNAVEAGWSLPDIARLRLALGTALELSGNLAAARSEYFAVADVARSIDDLALLADAVVAATPRESILDEDFAERLNPLVDEVLAGLDHDDHARIRLLHSAALGRVYLDPAALPAIMAESERLTLGASDPDLQHWNLVTRYLSVDPQDNPVRLAISRDIHHHTRHHQLVAEMGGASRRLLVELLVCGALEEFDHELADMTRIARTTSIPDDLYWTAGFGATRALMHDCGRATEELINGAALLGRHLQVGSSDGVQMLQTFALRYQQDRIREIAGGLTTPSPTSPQILAGTSLLALALSTMDPPAAARAILDRAIVDNEITLPVDNFRTAAIALFAGAAARCGTPAQRRVLRKALERKADQFCVFGAGGAVFGTNRHWLARLAVADHDLSAAIEHLRRAQEMCHHADAAYWGRVAAQERDALTEGIGRAEPPHSR